MISEPLGKRSPLVSIIIPSLNQARFIEETIQSVLLQSYPSIEVIVVDGGSRDGTVDLLRKYDTRIRWISEPDAGHADAVNKGFRMARGELVGWLNSDDVYFYRDSVQRAVRAFDDHPDADIVYGDAAKIAEDSTILRMYFSLPYDGARMQRANQITQPAVFMRSRVAAEPLGNYVSLDYEYWLRLGQNGCIFRHIPTLIAGDRQYRGRASISMRAVIDAEIVAHQHRYSRPAGKQAMLKFADRAMQATCRLRGFLLILRLIAEPKALDRLAFPGRIDSFSKLLFRQAFRNVLEVF